MRGVLALVAFAACGRIDFDPLTDGSSADVATDTESGVTCWPAWQSGAPVIGMPRRLDELVSAAATSDPLITADARTLYFARVVSGQGYDVFTADRPDRTSMFGAAMPVTAFNSASDDTRVSITGDGRLAILTSTRTPTVGADDLYESTRASTADPFGAPDKTSLAQVNSTLPEVDGYITDNGLSLYFSVIGGPGQYIQVATRSSTGSAFGTPAQVTGLVNVAYTADPALSPDELVLLYTAYTGAATGNDLFFATRSSTAVGFTNVGPVPTLNTASSDGDASPSRDGCELFFISDRAGLRELYVASVSP